MTTEWKDRASLPGTSIFSKTPCDLPSFHPYCQSSKTPFDAAVSRERVAEKPEHYFACYRLILPGQTYYLTIEGIVHCEDCALSKGVIRVREDLAVDVKRDRLLIQRSAQVGKGNCRLPGLPSTTPTPVL